MSLDRIFKGPYVRLSTEQEVGLIDALSRLCGVAESRHRLEKLWRRFILLEEETKRNAAVDLSGADFSRFPDHDLLEAFEASCRAPMAVEAFFPAPYSTVPFPPRRWIFLTWQMLVGLYAPEQGLVAESFLPSHFFARFQRTLPPLGELDSDERALLSPCLFAWAESIGDPAAREIGRRGAKHPGGFYAATLLLGNALRGIGMRDPRLEKQAESCLNTLRKFTWSKIPPGVLQTVSESEATSVDREKVLDDQIIETVATRWGTSELDPLEVVRRALSGKLDIAPRAVANDLVDRARHERVRQRFHIDFFERRPDGGVDESTDPEEAKADESPGPEEFAMLLCRVDPESRTLLAELLASGGLQTDLASRLGIPLRTVERLMAKLKTLLKDET